MINKLEVDYDSGISGVCCGREINIYNEGGHDEEQAKMIVTASNNFLSLVGILILIKNEAGKAESTEENRKFKVIYELAKSGLNCIKYD